MIAASGWILQIAPVSAAAKKASVESMHHQLRPVKSLAYGFVAQISSTPVRPGLSFLTMRMAVDTAYRRSLFSDIRCILWSGFAIVTCIYELLRVR